MDFVALSLVIVDTAIRVRRRVSNWLLSRQAAHWPLVGGRIFDGRPDPDLNEIYYSYEVNGQYYSGYFARKHLRAKDPHDISGQSVLVRYQPDRPEVSFLFDSDQIGSLTN